MHRIDTAGNVGGLFADPVPGTQVPVVCDSAWLNDFQENVMAVLAAASIAPVKGIYTQLRDAIKSLIAGALTHVVDTGAANVYVIAPTPALAAYAEGASYSVRFIHANTGASTINVSGLGAKAITHPDGTALIAGDIPAGAEAIIVYDGTEFQLNEGVDGQATTTVQGLVKLATNALAIAGTDATTAVTPAALSAAIPTHYYAEFQDQQPSGTNSGESIPANTWTARNLDTIVANALGVTLSGSQMVGVPAGTYLATGQAYAQKLDAASSLLHKVRIRDVTHGVTLVSGEHAGVLGYSGTTIIGTSSQAEGIFTLGATATIELDSYTSSAATGGNADSTGDPEVYAVLRIIKLA